jgi:hypothetical protein
LPRDLRIGARAPTLALTIAVFEVELATFALGALNRSARNGENAESARR